MRINQYTRQVVEPDTAGGVLRQGSGEAEFGAAKALQPLQQATIELAQRAQEAARTADVAMRTLAVRRDFGMWYAQRSRDRTQYATLAADSQAMLDKIGKAALEGVTDPLSQAAIQREVYEFSTTALMEAENTGYEQQIDWTRGALQEQTWLRRQEVAGAPEYERPRLVQQMLAIIQAQAASGVISPLDAEKQARAFVDGVAEDELNIRVYNDPDGVLADLYSGKYGAMSVENRQRITINAEKRAEALRNERAADRRRTEAADKAAHRAVQDLNFGTYYNYVKAGQIGTAALYDALQSGEIRGEQFRTLADTAEAVSRAGGAGDPEAADSLAQRAYRGTLTVGDVLAAQDGPAGINRDETAALLELLEKGSAATNTRDYKEAVKYVEGTLGLSLNVGGGVIKGAMDPVTAMAIRELYTRVVSDGKADPMSTAQDIVERYQKRKVPGSTAPKPRYPTLDEAKAAYRRGDITGREFDTEAAVHGMQRTPTP